LCCTGLRRLKKLVQRVYEKLILRLAVTIEPGINEPLARPVSGGSRHAAFSEGFFQIQPEYVQICAKQHNIGHDKDGAFRKCHELMAGRARSAVGLWSVSLALGRAAMPIAGVYRFAQRSVKSR
jgi:hypothetical protein